MNKQVIAPVSGMNGHSAAPVALVWLRWSEAEPAGPLVSSAHSMRRREKRLPKRRL